MNRSFTPIVMALTALILLTMSLPLFFGPDRPAHAQIAPAGHAGVGDSLFFFSTALTGTVVSYKATGGTVAAIDVNNGATACFLQFHNLPTSQVTLGSTTPTVVFSFPASTARTITLHIPMLFSTAISVAATTTATGAAGCQPTNVTLIGQ